MWRINEELVPFVVVYHVITFMARLHIEECKWIAFLVLEMMVHNYILHHIRVSFWNLFQWGTQMFYSEWDMLAYSYYCCIFSRPPDHSGSPPPPSDEGVSMTGSVSEDANLLAPQSRYMSYTHNIRINKPCLCIATNITQLLRIFNIATSTYNYLQW